MKIVTKKNFALISTFARELARNLRAEPFPVEVVGGAGPRRPRPENGRRGNGRAKLGVSGAGTVARTRRGGTDGEGRRGRQTEYMERQRKAFLEYLKEHPETASVSRITRARECWAIHRKEWNAAAKKGVGYSDYKALSRAKLM